MKTKMMTALLGVALAAFTTGAMAGDADHLIELDKAWGTAGMAGDTDTVAGILADDLVAVETEGVGGKAEQLAANEPAPEGATYNPTDYTVSFLDEHTAIMTHGTTGENAHYSLHVWSDMGGSWQVVATSSVPAAAE